MTRINGSMLAVVVFGGLVLGAGRAEASVLRLLDHSLRVQGDAGTLTAGLDMKLVDGGGGGASGASPCIAGCLSALIPGVGELYNGEILKGIGFLVVVPGLLFLGSAFYGSYETYDIAHATVTLAVLVYVWGIFDAYQVAATGSGGGGDELVLRPRDERPYISVVRKNEVRAQAGPVPQAMLSFNF